MNSGGTFIRLIASVCYCCLCYGINGMPHHRHHHHSNATNEVHHPRYDDNQMHRFVTDVARLADMVRDGVDFNYVKNEEGSTLLHLAVKKGAIRECKFLVDNGCSPKRKDKRGRTPLHLAVLFDRSEACRFLIEKMSLEDLNAVDQDSRTALLMAVYNDRVNMAEMLLLAGSDPNVQDIEGNTVLHFLRFINTKNRFRAFTRLLMQHGASWNILTRKNESPLSVAIRYEKTSLIEILIQHGCPLTGEDVKNISMVKVALSNNKNLAFVLIKKFGANVNEIHPDFQNRTPLHIATLNSLPGMMKLLIGNGAALDAKDKNGATSLHLAAFNGLFTEALILVHNKADLNASDALGFTPLHSAINGHRPILLRKLLESEVNVESRNIHGQTPLHRTALHGSIPMFEALLHKKANVTAVDDDGRNCLHFAVYRQHTKMMKYLLDTQKLDVDSRDFQQRTPLHLAALRRHRHFEETRDDQQNIKDSCECISLLLDAGCSLEATNSEGCTPLHFAAMMGNIPEAQFLLKRGANKNALDGCRQTPFFMAVIRDHYEMAEFLLEAGVDASISNQMGLTPLHAACEFSSLEMVDFLMRTGLRYSINARDNLGRTPAHLAMTRKGKYPIRAMVEYLIHFPEINLYAVDDEYHSLLHKAVLMGSFEITFSILQRFAELNKIPNVNSQDIHRQTAIQCATSQNRADLVNLLLATEAVIPNLRDMCGNTALHFSVETSPDVICSLLHYGFNVHVKNLWGYSPLDVAVAGNNVEFLQLANVDFVSFFC